MKQYMINDTHHFWEDTLKSPLNETKVDKLKTTFNKIRVDKLIKMINDNREVLEDSDEMYKLMIHVQGVILDAKLSGYKKKGSE